MASLSSGLKLGTGSVSSLIKSANSLQTQLANYQDQTQAFEYQNSAYTDDAFSSYSTYLNGRIKTLQGTGTLADASKALTLTKTLEAAMKSNVSASIQRENIQILSGNASKQDKYNLISSQYVRAVNNGDLTLAQSLESQAYSLSQSIQYDQQQAANAAATLASSSASKEASGEQHVATQLEVALKQFNQDYAASGQKGQQKALKDFVNSPVVQQQLKTLGVSLPKGATPNYFDVVEGVMHGIYQAHSLAALAEEPYNPDTAQTYADAANAIVTGEKKYGTLSGNLSLQDVQQASTALASGQLAYNATTGGFGTASIPTPQGATASGFKFVPNQGVQVQLSPNAFKAASPQLAAELNSLGLQYNPTTNGQTQGEEVQVTSKSPDWLRKLVPVNTLINVFQVKNPTTGQNMIQFKADSSGGPGSSVYSIIQDASGKHALAEEGQQGSIIHGGDYGFNSSQQPASHTSFLSRLGSMIGNSASSLFGHFSGNASAQDLLSGATQFQIAQANAKAAAAMLAYKPSPLPNISIPQVAPPPAIKPSPTPNSRITINPFPNQSITPKTVNPQSGNSSPQLPGSFNLQGGGGIRLQ